MSNAKPLPHGLTQSLSREHSRYLAELRKRINEKLDDESGLTGTYTFGGGSAGDVASMTFINGILTAVTTV